MTPPRGGELAGEGLQLARKRGSGVTSHVSSRKTRWILFFLTTVDPRTTLDPDPLIVPEGALSLQHATSLNNRLVTLRHPSGGAEDVVSHG
ncbi:MAG: hypothetical protein NNA23_07240 [Nitrospira sp.]|nr:hypothetical protein [Nitrospira sp.]MCP9465571.1 hypothetical protein [Nitrospira sp.]